MTEWRIAFAHAVGTSHTATRSECQDSCEATIIEKAGEEFCVACVADGAGSAANSATGSSSACGVFIRMCRDYLNSGASISGLHEVNLRDDWLESLRQALVDKAAEEGLPCREFATTFLAAIASRWKQ
jgi:serine/threonine protein phosphatase PrpC